MSLSSPLAIADLVAFKPYVGFRMDYMLPLVSSSTSAANDHSEPKAEL